MSETFDNTSEWVTLWEGAQILGVTVGQFRLLSGWMEREFPAMPRGKHNRFSRADVLTEAALKQRRKDRATARNSASFLTGNGAESHRGPLR